MEEGEDDLKAPAVASSVTVNLTGDPEHDKKLKNIKKVRTVLNFFTSIIDGIISL